MQGCVGFGVLLLSFKLLPHSYKSLLFFKLLPQPLTFFAPLLPFCPLTLGGSCRAAALTSSLEWFVFCLWGIRRGRDQILWEWFIMQHFGGASFIYLAACGLTPMAACWLLYKVIVPTCILCTFSQSRLTGPLWHLIYDLAGWEGSCS